MTEAETKKRHRHQLVIALGEGQPGAVAKVALEKAAKRAGTPLVSVWARELLFEAARVDDDGLAKRSELVELRKRVRVLEGHARDRGWPIPTREGR